jgi:regulator of protease activity HflC (stomatin/prohibitin superfamily)
VQIVPAESRAVVLRFGNVAREEGPGLLFALPEPFERVVTLASSDRQLEYAVKAVRRTTYIDSVAVSRDPRQNAGMLLTGDGSVVHLEATLFYRISDATAYVLSREQVEPAIERLFVASAVTVAGGRDLDTILVARPERETSGETARAGRERLRGDLMDEVNRRLADLERQGASLGIVIGRVDLLPSIPAEAKVAFDSVLVAIQRAETEIAQARTQAEQTAQRANQQRDRILTDAQAKAEEVVTDARTRTAAIEALAAQRPGLAGDALARQLYAERVGPLLGKAAEVLTTDVDGGANLIVPGPRR